jgi:hypothetical protein
MLPAFPREFSSTAADSIRKLSPRSATLLLLHKEDEALIMSHPAVLLVSQWIGRLEKSRLEAQDNDIEYIYSENSGSERQTSRSPVVAES